MAEKESTLAIVIRTVDRATAGLRKINGAINSLAILAAPVSLVGERLGALAKEAGLPKIVAGFKGLGEPIQKLAGQLLMIGGVAVGAVLELKHLVGEFDDLGDKAEAMGVSADFLAQMRFAAERSGAEVEQLDSGIKTLSTNMGLLRAGTGKMKKFLEQVSPALAAQLKGTKNNEEAFLLLARAMEKIKDPAKRAALAQKVFGDSDLGPLLARGADGIEELRGRFLELAGSQADAVEVAGATDDSFKDLGAAVQGVKAALVTGFGPALRQIVDELRAWFAENRGRIAEWAKDFGRTLPEKIHKFAEAFLKTLDSITKFIDGMGGAKTMAIAAAAVIAGPLIQAIVALGLAMAASPIGIFLAGLGAIAFMAKSIHDAGPRSSESFTKEEASIKSGALPGKVGLAKPTDNEARLMASGALPKSARFQLDQGRAAALAREAAANIAATRAADVERQKAHVQVDFANVPRFVRVTTPWENTADLDLKLGFNMMGAGL